MAHRGIYFGPDGKETVAITKIDGVQAQHTRGTFEWDSSNSQKSPVAVFEEIPISKALADNMREAINTQIAAGAKFLKVEEVFGIDALHELALLVSLFPESQKGAAGNFTCVGILEWAAEQAGHNSGQGFIYDYFESVKTFGLPGLSLFPLLSPELLNYSMKLGNELDEVGQWFQGGFDPVDFMITDPLGRKLGYTEALGQKNELPHAFYPGDGVFEQFLIPNPVAGPYTVEFVGLDSPVAGAMGSVANTEDIYTELTAGELLTVSFDVEMQVGVPGDVNRDGCINYLDATALSAKLNTFPNDLFDPADIDGNGVIQQVDLELLGRLIALNVPCATRPDLAVKQIVATEAKIQVIIQNEGTAAVPAEQGFWVDLYIDPSAPPTQPNQIWNFLAEEGLVWGVDGDVLPMEPGEVITLTLGDALYWPDLSKFSGSLPADTPVYVQVDSANTESTYGGVLESHEAAGGPYNNVVGPVMARAGIAQQRTFLPLLNGQGQAVVAGQLEDTPQHTLPTRVQPEMEN
jgi:hypothetical protein